MEESWTSSLTCLCLSRLGLGLFLGQNKPMMLVFAILLHRLWPWHHPRASKITGRGRSSQLEGHSHKRYFENRWVSCQLPRVPTPCEIINLTNQCPDRKLMCRWNGRCMSSQSLMCLPSHCCRCPCPVNSNHGFNLRQNGGHFDMGSFPRPLIISPKIPLPLPS